jgi:alpha-glucoside transport system substrate-binding protein
MKTRLLRIALTPLAVLSMTGLGGCAATGPAGSVTVLAPWVGVGPDSERAAFNRVLDAFTDETGIQVNYQGTRTLSQALVSGGPGGAAPDVAILSSPGDFKKYARDGKLLPLDDLLDDKERDAYSDLWLLSMDVNRARHVYAVPIKANLKSLVWYNPTHGKLPAETTWPELANYVPADGTTPWCMGTGDEASSGWPGVDLINDIFLHTFGPNVYREWAAGLLPWTSPQVRQAWTSWGTIASTSERVHGGPRTVMLTDFGDAGRPLFTDPPGCAMQHQASFIMNVYQGYDDMPGGRPEPGEDFDFIPFPSADGKWNNLWNASVDLAGMFNDSPQARKLLNFLATDKAQRMWPSVPGGGAFTVDKNVRSSQLHRDDPVSQKIDRIFQSNDTFCLGAADIMPSTMRSAYSRAVLEFLSNPDSLEQILTQLERVRLGIPPEDWLNLRCGT